MRILIDMDGVLADFEAEFLKRWRQRHPAEPWVALEDRRSFPLKFDYPEHLHQATWDIISESGFFAAFSPIEGGRDALTEMLAMGHDVRICTSPFRTNRTCMQDKVDWVERFLGPEWTRRLVITRDKTIVIGDVLIDDRPEVVGAEQEPTWEHVYYDQPYNRDRSGRRLTWRDWREVLTG